MHSRWLPYVPLLFETWILELHSWPISCKKSSFTLQKLLPLWPVLINIVQNIRSGFFGHNLISCAVFIVGNTYIHKCACSMEETIMYKFSANLNFLFLSLCVYLFKKCLSQFFSFWVPGSQLSQYFAVRSKTKNKILIFSSGRENSIFTFFCWMFRIIHKRF